MVYVIESFFFFLNVISSSFFNFWSHNYLTQNLTEKKNKTFLLNFGPQHPASHGVLRMAVQLEGEIIDQADAHVGFLHRGTEKLIENRNFNQALPYFDRLDYVSMMAQEHAFCVAIEHLLNSISYSTFFCHIRVLFDELTRILNHLLAISTHSLDVGNMSPMFWAFEEREKIMEFYERVSGARMHAAFFRPNQLDWTGLNKTLFNDINFFLTSLFKTLTEMYITLSTNKIWKSRLVRIGEVTFLDVQNYSLTGPIARSVGIYSDLRLLSSTTYASYWQFFFKSYLGFRGDCYDRFLIRMREMYESINIIFQILFILSKKTFSQSTFLTFFDFLKIQTPYSNLKKTKYSSMETLIKHFKYYSEGETLPNGFIYKAVEAPKGEFGVSIITTNSSHPYRLKMRTPAYHHMHVISKLVQGHFFADLVTVLGSQDIVFGDVDR